MPRPRRIHLSGVLYYVTSRSMEGTPLFKDQKDYATYLELLKGYQTQFSFKLFAFLLLPDHIQLCCELTTRTTLSTIMHAINSRYTKYYNKRYGHTGHLFQQRFKDVLMEKTSSLLRVTSYLHLLPVRLGMVGHPRAYRWSSYTSYVDATAKRMPGTPDTSTPSTGLRLHEEVEEVLQQLTCEFPRQTYEQYALAVPAHEWDQCEASLRQGVVGSEAFIASVKRHRQAVSQRRTEPARPAPQPQPHPSPLRAQRRPSLALAGSVAVAFVTLGVAGLYATNLSSVKQTVQALGQKLDVTIGRTGEMLQAKLATFESVDPRHPTAFIRSSSLNGTSWDVEVRPLSASGDAAIQIDRLRFERDMVLSSRMSERGVMPSAYTLRSREGGTPVWEATQIGRDGEVIRWHGEYDGQTMQGVMTQQKPGQTAMSFSFAGTVEPQTAVAGQGMREI